MRHTAKAAKVALQSKERMFEPGLADLFKAVVITGSAAHAIQILRNDGVIRVRQRKPIQLGVSVITRSRPHPKANKAPTTSTLRHGGQISHDDIRARD